MGKELEPFVVITNELAIVLEEWVDRHQSSHPRNIGKAFQGDTEIQSYGAMRFLADAMGARSDVRYTETKEYRLLVKIKNRVNKHTPLSTADTILAAMEETYHLFVDVRPIPNPKLSQETFERKRAEALVLT
jgi:hypothetical protein